MLRSGCWFLAALVCLLSSTSMSEDYFRTKKGLFVKRKRVPVCPRETQRMRAYENSGPGLTPFTYCSPIFYSLMAIYPEYRLNSSASKETVPEREAARSARFVIDWLPLNESKTGLAPGIKILLEGKDVTSYVGFQNGKVVILSQPCAGEETFYYRVDVIFAEGVTDRTISAEIAFAPGEEKPISLSEFSGAYPAHPLPTPPPPVPYLQADGDFPAPRENFELIDPSLFP